MGILGLPVGNFLVKRTATNTFELDTFSYYGCLFSGDPTMFIQPFGSATNSPSEIQVVSYAHYNAKFVKMVINAFTNTLVASTVEYRLKQYDDLALTNKVDKGFIIDIDDTDGTGVVDGADVNLEILKDKYYTIEGTRIGGGSGGGQFHYGMEVKWE